MRLRLVIAYDGAPYCGWQSQPQRKGIQDVMEAAFFRMGHSVRVHGAGRTDAGVHALGQCAHVDVPGAMAPADWARALNANLPESIRVLRAVRAAEDFHARFSATGKVYRYRIVNADVLPPLEAGRAWQISRPLDEHRLREAASLLVGRHDFSAFSARRGGREGGTHRELRGIAVRRRGRIISLTFVGEGFLYKMVRMLVGAIVRVALDREPAANLGRRLRHGGPRWNHVAPAGGLYLVRVLYR